MILLYSLASILFPYLSTISLFSIFTANDVKLKRIKEINCKSITED